MKNNHKPKDGWVIHNGGKTHHIHGVLHCDDGPAAIYNNGQFLEYYQHGLLHRDGGPAVIVDTGLEKYYQYGELHREDGPAVVRARGTHEYFIHGKRHRDDGPAVIWTSGKLSYYYNNSPVKEGDFLFNLIKANEKKRLKKEDAYAK